MGPERVCNDLEVQRKLFIHLMAIRRPAESQNDEHQMEKVINFSTGVKKQR